MSSRSIRVVVAAARAHFGLREDARYRVHVADAADWMTRAPAQTYDYVLLDAYAGEGIPAPLATQAFFEPGRPAAGARRRRPDERGGQTRRKAARSCAPSPPR